MYPDEVQYSNNKLKQLKYTVRQSHQTHYMLQQYMLGI